MKTMVIVAIGASMLAACAQEDRCASASNPAECRQWADAGGDINDYLVGGMAGYMLGSMMNGGRRETVIVRDPGYRGPIRSLHSPIPSARDQLVRRQQRKIEAQKVEIRRQQDANRRLKAQARTQSRPSFGGGSSRPSRTFSGGSRRR